MLLSSARWRRYPSDTSVAEWALIEPLLPRPACRTKLGGRPEKWPRRDIVDAIRHLVDNGVKWRALPADYPPWQTVYYHFAAWHRRGVIGLLRDQLRRQIRTGQGRCPWPVTLIVDSQSVKGAETVSEATRGFDAGKKVNGRKRHIAVDTLGLPVMITVTPADTTDRDAARELLWRLRVMQPQITQVWADSAYGGQLVNWSGSFLDMSLKTVSRPCGAKGFVVLPRLESRTDPGMDHESPPQRPRYERLPQHSEVHLTWALITLMTRRITRGSHQARWTRRV
ncbi:IS5 family transposase [Streptomyces sp. NPDC045714]|uniref:IS5 family transposase n=1 Tax=Streptomyces sp. NPDC045714 TaxID=3154913 RepID=UPI0033FBCF58